MAATHDREDLQCFFWSGAWSLVKPLLIDKIASADHIIARHEYGKDGVRELWDHSSPA